MPNQTIINPGREIRFRRTALAEGATEVWVPIFRGRQGDHEFLGYYEARPVFGECQEATTADGHASGHALTGFAKIRVEVLELEPAPATEDPDDDEDEVPT
jgi:hypothetical protein